jgi:membrane fusion protein, multidrug efflux system
VEPVIVKTTIVKAQVLPLEARAIGTLVAPSVDITPEMAGHIEKIFFKDGSVVKQGEPLILLDDAIYRAKHESAKARLIYSENNHKRMVLLGKQGAIAKQAIDQAESDLKEKQAEAKESEVTMNKMTLTAPFSGVVGQGKINLGEYVTVGQGLVTLIDHEHLRIEYTIPEKFLSSLKLGQTVKVISSAYPDKVFLGKVAFISPAINVENRSVSLYAEVDNKDRLLASGMFVNVTHSLGVTEQALLVPAKSIVPILEGAEIYKVVDGKAHAVKVVMGARVNDSVEILQGLAAGDEIITDGQQKIKTGTPVKLKA